MVSDVTKNAKNSAPYFFSGYTADYVSAMVSDEGHSSFADTGVSERVQFKLCLVASRADSYCSIDFDASSDRGAPSCDYFTFGTAETRRAAVTFDTMNDVIFAEKAILLSEG